MMLSNPYVKKSTPAAVALGPNIDSTNVQELSTNSCKKRQFSGESNATNTLDTSTSKLLNPYTKEKSIPVATVSDIDNTKRTELPNNPYKKRQFSDESYRQSSQIEVPPSPIPVNEFTTFSQAFGNPHQDTDLLIDEEQAQRIAFNQSIVSKTKRHQDLQNNDIDPRDNHAMLQSNILHISTRQRGNPIIEYIRNVPYKFSELVPDYIMGVTRCALFLSLRYHNLHPNYIHRRIAELKSDFEYRMLLCLVDIEDNASPILFLNDLCVQNNYTLILAWSEEEAARYLETVRAFDGKDPTPVIGKHEPKTHIEKVIRALGSVPSVNKADASQLLTQFGCWRNLVNASIDELGVCPGIGPKKVRRLYEAFHRPFMKETNKKRQKRECKTKENENEEKGDSWGGKVPNKDSEVADGKA